MRNEITAYFKGTTGVAESVYQYDYGMIMNIDGLTLSETFDVHFEISGSPSTITAIGSNNRVAIPNDCLAVPGKVSVYIYTHTGSHDGETAYVVTFQVINRARPDDDITDASEENNAKAIVRLQTEHEADVFKINENLDAIENAATALTGRVTTAEDDIDVLEGRIDTAISAVTTDTEVTDIRVGADGTTYTTAGNAVRGQITDLKDASENLLSGLYGSSGYLSYVMDGNINSQGKYAVSGGQHFLIPISPSDEISITAKSSTSATYAILTQFENAKAGATASFSAVTGFTTRLSLTAGESITFTAPSDSAYLYVTKYIPSSDFTPTAITVNGRDMFKKYDEYDFKERPVVGLTDLNDATKSGSYGLASSVDYANSPIAGARAANLIVNKSYGGNYFIQDYYINGSDATGYKHYRRLYSNHAWQPWVEVYSLSDAKEAYQPRSALSLTDLDDATEVGVYTLSASATYAHSPLSYNTASDLIVYKSKDSEYRIQEFHNNKSNGSVYEVYRRFYSGSPMAWTAWEKVYSLPDFKALENASKRTMSESFERNVSASQGANSGIKLRAMSYNICQFNNDTATYISDEKLFNLKKMLYKADADILAIQEDAGYIDGSSQSSDNYFYYPKYPYKNGTGGTTIRSKTSHSSGNVLTYSNGRTLRFSVYDISASIKLLVISTHPVANQDSTGPTSDESIAARNTQYDELFKWIKGEITLNKYGTTTPVSVPTFTHCIIGMDANSITDTDKTNLTNKATSAGYIMGNGGALGWFVTSLRGGDASIDNIIVSPNVIINNIESYCDWYDKLYSDHVPVIADVTLL